MRGKYPYKRIVSLCLAAALSAGSGITAWADETPQQLERLQDNQIEYDELFDLITHCYTPIKSAYDAAESGFASADSITIESSIQADEQLRMADELKEQAKDAPLSEAAGLMQQSVTARVTGEMMRQQLFMSNQKTPSQRASAYRALDRAANGVVYQAEGMMNQYQQLLSQRQIAAKSVELAQKARDVQVQMEAQGMAVGADVLSAAAQLSNAQTQLKTLDDSVSSIKEILCSFAGKSADENPQIGPVPAADPGAVAAIDLAADLEKAVNNNYNVIAMRGSGSSQSVVEQQLVKSTTAKKNKLRDTEYLENQVRSNVQTLYDDILEKKALYDSASTAWESARNTWNSVQVQQQTGMLSQIQYLQQEIAYLQAKSAMECADLNLQKSMRSYEWAVKGVEVTVQ